MAAQDPDHSGELYLIIISIPAQHDYFTCSAEAWIWSCLRVAQAEMSKYVTQIMLSLVHYNVYNRII